MKVLVIGSGGREHAITWKLAQSPKVTELIIAPGNAGTAELGENVEVKAEDIDGLLDLARARSIDLTFVGPEQPLIDGIADRFNAAGLKVFGPTAAAARHERAPARGCPERDLPIRVTPDPVRRAHGEKRSPPCFCEAASRRRIIASC